MANEDESQATILVVDDELGMREGCRRVLVPAGYDVDTASDLGTAQNLMQAANYDIYLLDVMLPDGSGLDLLADIVQRDPQAICIIVTGFGSIDMAVEAVRQGAYDFLSKPFTADELLIAVGQGLERRELKAIEAQAGELARAKAELERLDQAKSQLMLQMAHELRAPVAAVQSYINLILAGYTSPEELEPTLSRVHERLEEVLDLITDLLELAHLKQASGFSMVNLEPQDMAAILTKVSDLFQQQANDKEQIFQVEILGRPSVTADPKHLEQIWTNLISNAIKYTPHGGRITVTLQSVQDTARGTVADSGIGVSAEALPHLFEDFFRTDEAKATGEIGTGLGLSIVKQIVESYQGELSVTSEPGQGSRFTFVLPSGGNRQKAGAQSEGRELPGATRPSLPKTCLPGSVPDDQTPVDSQA